jgi:hypothetical protein
MNGRLIPLAVLLTVLSGCPETPPEASRDVAPAREEIAISRPIDSAAATGASDARLEAAATAVN